MTIPTCTATRTAGCAVLLLLFPLLSTSPATAQGWTLDGYAGRVSYDLATSAPSENGVMVGVRYRDEDTGWLYLSTGVPFGSNDSPWGAAGLGTRLDRDVGAVDVGIDLGARGYLYRDPALSEFGSGGILQAHPLVGFGDRDLRVELRSGWTQYRSGISASTFSRGVHDSDLTLQAALGRWIRVSGIARHVRAEEDDYTFGGGRMTVGSSRFGAWSSVGSWASDVLPTVEWGAGAYLSLDDAGGTQLRLSIRQEASDPVYWNSPRERWSIGISRSLGGGQRSVSGPAASNRTRAAPTPEIAEGRVTIRLPVSESGDPAAPSVAGDFTGWEPVTMTREDGYWTATFRVEPGAYRYAFRAPKGEWFVPEGLPSRRPDGMGGFVAVLVVS